ncbi:MAG TPA: hypothetical protein VHT96_07875 [Clostridia bacterium]|nr:hypothetical protein [Clostridia bacterium]
MENIDMIELRKQLASLPVLQDKLRIVRSKIDAAVESVEGLLKKYEAESLDVEKLQKDSLRTLILKNFGRYEDKLDKETDEMLAAKLEYDKACVRLNELKATAGDVENRIAQMLRDKGVFEEELNKREAAVRSGMDSAVSLKYKELEGEQAALAKRLVETEEARSAAGKALSTAGSAMEHLRKAENWATFDTWSRGGIISHMAKYQHIDDAEEDFHRLDSQLEDLGKELQDISLSGITGIDGIDSATRTVDFWFDNIFTDLNVRRRIGDDYDRMSELHGKIGGIVGKLDSDIEDIHNKLNELDQRKKDLLVEFSG